MKSVYIAGPDVFRPEAKAFYVLAEHLCADVQLKALTPYCPHLTDPRAIRDHNLQQIRQSDGIVANYTPFRGCGADDGTAFETGYAHALGIPIVGYVRDKSPVWDRVARHFRQHLDAMFKSAPIEPNFSFVFPDGMSCETWGFKTNLMLETTCDRLVVGSLAQAIAAMREVLNGRP